MNEDRFIGNAKNLGGQVAEGFGQATGDVKSQVEGRTKQADIKLVVPYPPGGSTDVIARLVQPCLQERLATTVIIENRRERHLLSKERLRDCRCWQMVGLA